MDVYVWTLRVLHVAAGVFWAGATWMLAGILTPAVKDVGKPGQQVMRNLIQKRKLTMYLGVSGIITVLTGLLLYWRVSSGLNMSWLTSGRGISLTIGGVAGLLTLIIGFAVNRPSAERLGELGAQVAASEGPPEPEVMQELQSLQARLEAAGVWTAILLAVAVVAMAGAEQLFF